MCDIYLSDHPDFTECPQPLNHLEIVPVEKLDRLDYKILKLLKTKAIIESIDLAGNGSFDFEGDYDNFQSEDRFMMKVKYFYPDLIDTSKKYPVPKKFVWLFLKCEPPFHYKFESIRPTESGKGQTVKVMGRIFG